VCVCRVNAELLAVHG